MPFKKGESGNPKNKFKKGQSGNLSGRPLKLPQLDILMAEVIGADDNGILAAKRILQALYKRAIKGDVKASEVLMDRAYGKAKQSIDLNTNEVVVNIIPREPNEG